MTLVRTVNPLPDESLAGLVARAAGANVYPHARDVLIQACLGEIRPETIPIRDPSTATHLAEVLGTTPERLVPHFHQSLGQRKSDFYGVPLRQIYRETVKRRVSPRALRNAAYIRAIWSIRPFGFDPVTKEQLISACPVCGGQLGFTKTWGVEFCEHCISQDQEGMPYPQVDLRNFPQPLVEVEDAEALDFATSLVDPRREPAGWSLQNELSALSRGELFELIVAVASALRINRDGSQIPEHGGVPRGDGSSISPSDLADAGRAVLSWPQSFVSLCEEASCGSTGRQRQYGVRKEFGMLGALTMDPHMSLAARNLTKAAIDRALVDVRPQASVLRRTTRKLPIGQYVGWGQVIVHTPVSQKTVERLRDHPKVHKFGMRGDRTPIHFKTGQVAFVLDHYLDLMSEESLGLILGLPPDGVRDFGKYIAPKSGYGSDIAIDIAPKAAGYYSKTEAETVVGIITDGIPFQKAPRGFIPFSEAMLMFPAGHRPWLGVIETVLWNDVEVVFHKRRTKSIFGTVSIRGIEAFRDCILDRHSRIRKHDIESVTTGSANLMLGIYNYYVLTTCIERGLIDVPAAGRVRYRSVLDFADRFIFGNEAAVRSRNSALALRPWLASRGVYPVHDFDMKGGLVYDRDKVEPLLEMKV